MDDGRRHRELVCSAARDGGDGPDHPGERGHPAVATNGSADGSGQMGTDPGEVICSSVGCDPPADLEEEERHEFLLQAQGVGGKGGW